MRSQRFDDLLIRLSRTSAAEDSWPSERLDWVSDAGVLSWTIPVPFGGTEIDELQLLEGYERLTTACLTTSFILTQRNAAIQRIVHSSNIELKQRVLPELCTNRVFTTVGISHLTTSRRHWQQPTVRAEITARGFVLNGEVPWVTGAEFAEFIVIGAVVADGREVLLAVPTSLPGVLIQPPAKLLALNGSRTATVVLQNVVVANDRLLAGPTEQVLKQLGSAGTGSFTTSAIALGHARRSVEQLREEANRRSELEPMIRSFEEELHAASLALKSSVDPRSSPDQRLTPETMREQANSLAVRSAQAFLTVSKGAGFVSGHPAERQLREAMFFLVWSCPQPVLMAHLRSLQRPTLDQS